MSEPFVGEIRMLGCYFTPRGWAFCNGQFLAVSQNDALFSLLGTIYGGDGRTTFALPDIRGRIPLHQGAGPGLTTRSLGSHSGSEYVTLATTELPSHSHPMQASLNEASSPSPYGRVFSKTNDSIFINNPPSDKILSMSSSAVENSGGSYSHTNMMPTLCINFNIALFGAYPSRS